MLAANDQLFVITGDGSIHCFGGESAEPRQHALASTEDGVPPAALSELGLTPQAIGQLEALYGARLEVLAERLSTAKTSPSDDQDLDTRVLAAQVELAIDEEWALSLDDVLMRRISPGQLDLVTCWKLAPTVARLLANQLGWDQTDTQNEIDRYRVGIERDLEAAGGPVPTAAD